MKLVKKIARVFFLIIPLNSFSQSKLDSLNLYFQIDSSYIDSKYAKDLSISNNNEESKVDVINISSSLKIINNSASDSIIFIKSNDKCIYYKLFTWEIKEYESLNYKYAYELPNPLNATLNENERTIKLILSNKVPYEVTLNNSWVIDPKSTYMVRIIFNLMDYNNSIHKLYSNWITISPKVQ